MMLTSLIYDFICIFKWMPLRTDRNSDALLQKSYTVDFLIKEKNGSESDILQYDVKGNHVTITSPEIFNMVQKQMTLRKSGKNRISYANLFSSKIKSGDCDGVTDLKRGIPTAGTNANYGDVTESIKVQINAKPQI